MSNIKAFIPAQFNLSMGVIYSILQAVTASTGRLEDLIAAAIDQQFISTATGRYLLFLGEQSGFAMPDNSGLDIRALQALVPTMVASPKQVTATLNRLVEIFYGVDKTRTTVTSTKSEPFNLADGDDFIVETEEGLVGLGFLADQFSDITNVTCQEIAGVLNAAQSNYIVEVFFDRRQNKKFLRLISETIGTAGFVRVAGGTAQNVFQFPKLVPIIGTNATTWNVSKPSAFSDEVTIQWNGSGTNPDIYLTKPGDIVTIRGLVDGAADFSHLNGTFTLVDCGYDYIKIRDPLFQSISGTFTSPADNSIIVTSQFKNIIYDQEEYAAISETGESTVSVTVPAVPPLARRFLKGSTHLHGNQAFLVSFTRSTVQVNNGALDVVPPAPNSFVIDNNNFRADFIQSSIYKLNGSDGITPVTSYTLDTSTFAYNVFPFTTPQPVTLYFEVGSPDIRVDAGQRHGLQYRWGFTLDSAVTIANITATELNQEHVVGKLDNRESVTFQILDNVGRPISFQGITVNGFDVYRWSTFQPDGSDFYLQFSSTGAATASGLTPGLTFKFDGTIGAPADAFYASRLRFARLQVVAQYGNIITFRSGFGVGPTGLVITGGQLYRSSFQSGANYHFDQTSTYNKAFVMAGLRVTYREFTPNINAADVGSYVYDPLGIYYPVTVGGDILDLSQPVLKGSNQVAIFTDNVDDFPSTGKLMIDYGTSKQEGPISYLSIIANDSGDSQILIDPAYRFKFSHTAGAQIWNVLQTQPFIPSTDGADYPAYLTGTAQARDTLLTLLRLLVAAGVFLNFEVLFPNLRFADTAIQPYS